MQANIRIPLVTVMSASLLYGLAKLMLPGASIAMAILQAALVLVPVALLVHSLVRHELTIRDHRELALRQQATHDPLTGLVNRAHFQEILDRALARAERNRQTFGVAYIDLNDFKQVNDRHGHHVGDLLLTEVARRIGALVRAGDCAARFGGDEFVVLVDDRTDYGVYRLTERLRDAFAEPFLADGISLSITASIGVALYPDHGKLGVNLLKAADKAMYRAKSSRKGRAVTATSSVA